MCLGFYSRKGLGVLCLYKDPSEQELIKQSPWSSDFFKKSKFLSDLESTSKLDTAYCYY